MVSKATKVLEATVQHIPKENAGQTKLMLVLTFIAAVAAIIAAVPVVLSWLK